jgi:DNA-directed RNA polymerase subunit RPC12/RpoP
MPRKSKVQARGKAPRLPAESKKRIYQCMRCGALTDPMFGVGDVSWCPYCGECGDICYDEGKIPDPMFYGGWLKRHKQELAAGSKTDDALPRPIHPTPLTIHTPQGGLGMKVPNLHTGTYHCPDCGIEFDLDQEESLKCDRCNGLLVKGSIDDAEDEEEEDED